MAPTSPVKRVTRARAAAKKPAEPLDAALRKTATSRVTKSTASRKSKPVNEKLVEEQPEPEQASRTTGKVVRLAAAPRRRIKVTPLDAPAVQEEPEAAPEPQKAKKASSRTKKPAPPKENAAIEHAAPASKTRARGTKAAHTESTVKEAAVPKTRGRPKKAEIDTNKVEEEPATSTRQTRTRAGSNVETAPPKAAAVTRKKVTFQDLSDDDKENKPITSKKSSMRKEATPATGMRAKPIRKPAAATTKKKTPKSATIEEKQAPRALTPKKITQVARPTTPEDSDEEDILSGAKTPVRDLSQSPKRNPALAATLSPVKKLNLAQSLLSKSPQKPADSTIILSPARRPPPSPFKQTLKESPKRGDFGNIFPDASHSSMTAASALVPTSLSQSVLLQSPKRMAVDSSMFSQSAIKSQKSPLKASLLLSPAKRLFSPKKQRTPARSMHKDESTTPAGLPGVDSPEDIAISSHFRASVSPQRSVRVHRMSDEELADELRNEVDFDDSILDIRSPLKLTKSKAVTQTSDLQKQTSVIDEVDELQASDDGKMEQTKSEAMVTMDQQIQPADVDQLKTGESVDAMAEIEKQAAESESTRDCPKPRLSEILFRATRLRDEDESSEDELASDQTPDRVINPFRSSLTGPNLHSRLSGAGRNVGFTPLAAQMSGWLASSPQKKSIKAQENGGLFSPVAAQHVPGEVQVSRQSTPQQRKSLGLRKSFHRTSMAPSMAGSPEKVSYFAEQMIAQDVEDQLEETEPEAEADLHVLIQANDAFADDGEAEASEVAHDETPSDEEGDTIIVGEGNGELTTDLINFTNASDTALVHFAKLAQEAEELAPQDEEVQLSSSESVYGDENAAPELVNVPELIQETICEATRTEAIDEAQTVEVESIIAPVLETREMEVEAHTSSITNLVSPSRIAYNSIEYATPVRPDLSQPRFVNTIISKVPLRPEGEVSPIKIPRKRSQSFSTGAPGSAKRPHLAPSTAYGVRSLSENVLSPERRMRSAAPSPAHTTPGQMSFVIDDFGDSTLDGIELPDDEMDFDITQTPATLRSVKNFAVTPSRTPLKAVGAGILHGAVVYVDVHTTEGADASGIFVDLLTQMGAKCVKEWRWNSRSSIMPDDGTTPGKVGITHVVYKDGGKRTLEKVRDAKGEVWCVGVGWVLDCERENKWLDEATYAIDHLIMPRGGSRRRKSMEPKALINANGSLSAARRSVSAEMTEKMKEELINTPIRAYLPRESLAQEIEDDTEISSTYNSPTTSMNVGIATPTALVGWDPATAMTPAPVDTPYLMAQGSKLVQMSCPPKQINKGLFEEGEKGEQASAKEEKLKLKLAEARRKTMGWRPRIGSPLGKM